ncbi:MAG: pantetheine-phosphate adenylyltransferase [Wigglesworthia glossinidia]|nr:pantetheine-phosphate adenylyltransferase [Wigglesworthia glossinidia]
MFVNLKKAILPGTFDPITNGHINLINRAIKIFDYIFILVANSLKKKQLFNLNERILHVKKATRHLSNVRVVGINSLTMHFAKRKNINIIIRGIRNIFDFEYELKMLKMNKFLYPEIESVFMISDDHWSHVSSSMIKEIIYYGGNVDLLIPRYIIQEIKMRVQE